MSRRPPPELEEYARRARERCFILILHLPDADMVALADRLGIEIAARLLPAP